MADEIWRSTDGQWRIVQHKDPAGRVQPAYQVQQRCWRGVPGMHPSVEDARTMMRILDRGLRYQERREAEVE